MFLGGRSVAADALTNVFGGSFSTHRTFAASARPVAADALRNNRFSTF
jgi:hypothetical protein